MVLKKIFIIALVFVLMVVGWYFSNIEKSAPEASCSSLPAEERNACCVRQNNGTTNIDCGGKWQFDENVNDCSFVCNLDQEVRFCAQDVLGCPDGSFVSRDPKNNCEFKACA